MSASGVVKVVDVACTWHAQPTDPPTNSKFGYGTKPYTVTVTYSGQTTTAYVSVANAAGCYDGIGYPAPTGFAGN